MSTITAQEYLIPKYEATVLPQERILWYFTRYVSEQAFLTQNLTDDAGRVQRMDKILLPGLLEMYDFDGNKINENANLTKVLSTEDNAFVPTPDGGFLHFYLPLVKTKFGVMVDRYDKTMTKIGEPKLLDGGFELFSVAKGLDHILLAGVSRGANLTAPFVGSIFFDLYGNVVNMTRIADNIYNTSAPFQPTISVVPSPDRFFMINWACKSPSGDNILRANYLSSPGGFQTSRSFIVATAEKTKVVNRADYLIINKCSLLKAGDGHVCIYDYIVQPTDNNPNVNITRYTYSTVFSSTGSQFDLPTLLGNSTIQVSRGIGITRAASLPYGGALLLSDNKISNNQGITSYVQLYDRYWSYYPFENNTLGPTGLVSFPNNSVASLTYDTSTSGAGFFVVPGFRARIDNPPKFLNASDYGNNPIIKTTYPIQGGVAQISTTQRFSLTFIQSDYSTSLGHIYVYDANRPEYPRQVLSVSSDTPIRGDTFNFTLDGYALNLPGTEYYITIDGGTFQSAVSEPLEGLSPYQWRVTTPNAELSKDEKDDITVQVALDLNNTIERSEVANNLTRELTEALPVEANRISASFLRQDNAGDIYQITITKIAASQNRTATAIVNDFQEMIRTKARSPLSKGQYTQTLNSEFGVTVEEDLFRSNKVKFILLGVVVVVLIAAFAFLRRKYPSSDNAVVFVIFISVFDFCTDLLFVLLNSGDIRSLRAPSVIFFVIPFCFNMLSSTYIIVKEVARNPLFHEWFSNHTLLTSSVTILAATNPALIFILSSNFCVGILIEDIPQLVIQVIYKTFNGFFKIIPFLAVLSNCIGVIYAIVSQVYNYMSWRHDKQQIASSKRESKQHLSYATAGESLQIPESITTASTDNFRYSRSWIE
ncbi:hypothetical protein K493DRAFT_410651 [Basidiobolus meristosporus CBS 931.73]|uniref:Uncharacterized protein n=1 Tax=Basidiobolus meristosporus CBS 931.73 TaxID=1314790 RepID=A0A1Y1XTJ4_9FUNG|nr:hypothetical protein K493DRAFT_410651 [Basidiobolus meristosporus CBS 931.73]|eukprot:ORX89081.1 hypothetical protein K493DRAFT_410651 [Basidiobolus meristosporus CBS 931.73]